MADRMMMKVEWIHPDADIYDGSRVAFRDGELVVRGVVSLSPKKISVTLEFPKKEIMGIETLDSVIPVIFTENLDEHSPASPAGRDRVKRLLIKLYYSS